MLYFIGFIVIISILVSIYKVYRERKLDNLTKKLGSLKPEREWDRQRIVTLLEKIEQSGQISDVTPELVKKEAPETKSAVGNGSRA